MLQQTFIRIPGIGRETERELWSSGICCWDDADFFEKRFGGAFGARLQPCGGLRKYHDFPLGRVGRQDRYDRDEILAWVRQNKGGRKQLRINWRP